MLEDKLVDSDAIVDCFDLFDPWAFLLDSNRTLPKKSSIKGGGMKITKGSRIVTKGMKILKNLYGLFVSTIKEDELVSSYQVEN